ncbi:MAG: hypothetical protein AAB278_01665 [Pseudomonadota bacterium]
MAAQSNESSWAAHNRTLTANLSFVHQDYAENDPFGYTPDGTLDTERGTLRSAEFGARWQAETFPLQLQTTTDRSNEATAPHQFLFPSTISNLPTNAAWSNLHQHPTNHIGHRLGLALQTQTIKLNHQGEHCE